MSMPRPLNVMHFGKWPPSSVGTRPCFGSAMSERRRVLNLKPRAFAKLTGLRATAISDLENLSRHPPRPEHARRCPSLRQGVCRPLSLKVDE